MGPAEVVQIGQQALVTVALVAAPILLTALALGLGIGVLQAATSIQEMTLSFIPKLLGMAVAIAIFGRWMLGTLVDYTRNLIESIPGLIG